MTANCICPSHLPNWPSLSLPWTKILWEYLSCAVKTPFWSIRKKKTKVLAVGVQQLLQKLSSFCITLFDKELQSLPVVKDLGVLLDTCLSYNEHISKTASNCLLKLQQFNRIKHVLDRKTLLLVINSFLFSRLQYCSTVWSNTSDSNIDTLKRSKISLDELFWD